MLTSIGGIMKSHCIHGHEYTPENTKKNGKGYKCVTCEKTRLWIRARQTNAPWKSQNYARYGVTIAEVQALFESQHGLCAVCGNPETCISKRTGKPKMLHLDHDHKTGKVRGLLCQDCNMALGHMREDVKRIEALLDYVKSWQS